MVSKHKTIRILLPLAWIYGIIHWIRNLLYDIGLIQSKKASVKTIVVGNLAVGGTGKTPHVIWLANELSKNKNVAILSRGYKRKTKGFRWVRIDDHPSQTGDEPLEIKTNLPNIPVAIDSNRLRGISRIKNDLETEPDFIILDDGFQHRKLTPDFAIILSNSDRPYYSDSLLPAGRLREAASSIKRANALIITDTTTESLEEIRQNKKRYKLSEDQNLFTSSFIYPDITPITKEATCMNPDLADSAILVSGIARPEGLQNQWAAGIPHIIISYPDHHNYSESDVNFILSKFEEMDGKNKILVTTGKDAVKLKQFPQICEKLVYRQNREIIFDDEQKEQLLESILNHG